MKRKGWYITNSADEVVYNGHTYGECQNMVSYWEFAQETKPNKETYEIRFGV